jgi:hypothetical protein
MKPGPLSPETLGLRGGAVTLIGFTAPHISHA